VPGGGPLSTPPDASCRLPRKPERAGSEARGGGGVGQTKGRCSEPHMFEYMTTAKRIREAKAKTDRVVDHLLYLLELHANNAIITYSDTLSSQITLAHAADAFNVFRGASISSRSCACARCGTHRRLTRNRKKSRPRKVSRPSSN
jgi:hypothetical protein